MRNFFFVLGIAILGSAASLNEFEAFAEIGSDYDNILNEDGSYTFTSHYNRIWDGEQWQNFIISETEDNIIISSNAANTLSYDKQTCSYSVYDTGFIVDAALLPSVSWQANSAVNGTDAWNRMTVNDEVCMVEIINNGESVIIQSTKEITEDRNFEVKRFNPDNSTRIDIETRNVLAERLIHTILINDKIKETIDIYNIAEDTKLGATQTIHTDSINVGGQQLNLQDVSGQFFDRNWIEANEAQIFEVSDSLNYDFDVGFESLWGIGIESDQINLDFNNSPNATHHLNIDPTFTNTGNISGSNVTFTLSYPTLTNAIVSSGDIDGIALTSSQVTSLQSEIDSTNTSWTTTANTTPASPDYETDFSSNTGWTQINNDVTVDTSNSRLQYNPTPDSQDDRVYYDLQTDLGSTVDDEKWFVQYKVNLSGSVAPSAYQMPILSTHTDNLTSGTTVDQLGIWFGETGSGSGGNYINLRYADGTSALSGSYGSAIGTLSTGTDYYITMIRESATSFKIEVRTGSHTGSHVTGSPITSTIPSTIEDLRYIHFGDHPSSSHTRYLNSYIYDLSFYDGVTSTTPTTNDLSFDYITGTAPDPPTGVSTSINDIDSNPLDITVSWLSPSNVGTGTITGFEIYRDSALITTTGLVTTYDDTVSAPGTYVYKVRAVSTHGTSTDSNTSSITTPSVPDAITDLSGQVNSNTETSISWSVPNDGGSALTQFKILRDSVNIANVTSSTTSYTDTGLSDNTTYLYNVFGQNNAGTSTKSNDLSLTTYTGITGSISGTATTIGATTKIDVTPNVTAGTPTPSFNSFTVKEGSTTIATFTGTTGYVHHTDDSSHTYVIESTDSTHWQTPTITGTLSGVQSSYDPTWSSNVSYNYTRSTNSFDLIVNRDITPGWDLTCEYKTASQASGNQTGTTGVGTNMYAFQDSQSISDGKHVYVTCTENDAIVLSFVSYGPNLITGGLQLLDTHFGDFLGAPAAIFFVILAAGMFTGRSANTGILVVLSVIGVLGFIGMVTIDEASWGFILIAGVLGLFVGKRFL